MNSLKAIFLSCFQDCTNPQRVHKTPEEAGERKRIIVIVVNRTVSLYCTLGCATSIEHVSTATQTIQLYQVRPEGSLIKLIEAGPYRSCLCICSYNLCRIWIKVTKIPFIFHCVQKCKLFKMHSFLFENFYQYLIVFCLLFKLCILFSLKNVSQYSIVICLMFKLCIQTLAITKQQKRNTSYISTVIKIV